VNVLIHIICGLAFEVLALQLGFTIILTKAIVMTAILIIISFIVRAPLIDTILGMICSGGILFLLALIPNAMGGGDIKLMFSIGAFLGPNTTLWALLLAFIISSIISIALILLKIKGTKDYIPFGPFLSLGSFISLLIFI
jgi:leader peptidase (prepilin peptidase) / N-methyltransferase